MIPLFQRQCTTVLSTSAEQGRKPMPRELGLGFTLSPAAGERVGLSSAVLLTKEGVSGQIRGGLGRRAQLSLEQFCFLFHFHKEQAARSPAQPHRRTIARTRF